MDVGIKAQKTEAMHWRLEVEHRRGFKKKARRRSLKMEALRRRRRLEEEHYRWRL